MDIKMPDRIARLPLDPVRKVPVPYFVAWFDGKPEFRVADASKFKLAWTERRCWICGDRLDNRCTYIVGPMCVVNRVSSEPPSHPDCAEYAARACPFLARPHMERRESNMAPEAQAATSAGVMITRNPGVCCLWKGRWPGATLFDDGTGRPLFRLQDPLVVTWMAEGRLATTQEIWDSVDSGLPSLRALASAEGLESVSVLDRMIHCATPIFPPRPTTLSGVQSDA